MCNHWTVAALEVACGWHFGWQSTFEHQKLLVSSERLGGAGGLRLSELTSNTYLPQHGKAAPLPTFQWGKIQSWLRAWSELPSLDHWFYSSPRPWLSKIITVWEAGKLPQENELGGPRLVSHGQVSAPQNHRVTTAASCWWVSEGRSRTAWAAVTQVVFLEVAPQGQRDEVACASLGVSWPLPFPELSVSLYGALHHCCGRCFLLPLQRGPVPALLPPCLKGCKKFQRGLCVEGVKFRPHK